MKRAIVASLLALGFIAPARAQQPRLASEFEIAQMEKQLARSRGFEAQLSGRLNLGDVRAARHELSLAQREYRTALDLASAERLSARRESSLARYAVATSYAALAAAKLRRDAEAWAWIEEALRYSSDDPESWNLSSSAMRILGHPRKAVAAARNAVSIAERANDPLDLAVYRYALATALTEADERREAERILVELTAVLRSTSFDSLQRDVARQEAFEVYSSARGDVAAYVSLLNRSQLRLASLYEERGARDLARAEYARVLDARSDDVTALAALARLAATDREREQLYAEAFEANPLSLGLVREYQRHLRNSPDPAITSSEEATAGTRMRAALALAHRGDLRRARSTFESLLARFPDSETLQSLIRETAGPRRVEVPTGASPTAAELRALQQAFERLTPEQRAALDARTYTGVAAFDAPAADDQGRVAFASGTIEGIPFRFSEPTVFAGAFDPASPLRLTFRILGVTKIGDRDALLFEPVRLEVVQ